MKLRKILSSFIAICMIAASVPFTAYASNDPVVLTAPPVYCEGLGDVNDVAPETSFFGLISDSVFSGAYYKQLDEDSQKAYDALYEAYKNGASSEPVSIDIPKTFTGISLSGNSLSASSQNTINEWMVGIVRPAFLALVYDHPELSWLVNAGYSTGSSNIQITGSSGSAEAAIPGIRVTLSKVYTNTGTASDMKTAVSAALTAVNAKRGSDKSAYNTIKCINDYLAENITYNKKAAGNGYSSENARAYQTAYSAFYKCNGDDQISTVCAGYAKGFKVICDAYGIPCILVSGTGVTKSGSEAHMWNYVYVNEKWWGVDVTWNDQGETIYHDFLLVGGDDKPSAGFGTRTFLESHVPSGDWSGSGYIFKYPTLASGECTQDEAGDEIGDGSTDNLGGDIGNTGDGGGSSGGEPAAPVTEPGTIWAFGKDIKDNPKTPDINEATNYKTYSWQHVGNYSGGKWLTAVTPESVATVKDFTALFDENGKIGKTETDKAKKIASAKIKDGVVTVTSGKEAGRVTVWVYELKKNPATKKNEVVATDKIAPVGKTITVLAAPGSPVIAAPDDIYDGILAGGKKAVSKAELKYTVGGTQDTTYYIIGDKKTAFDKSAGFSIEIKDSDIVSASVCGSTLSLTPLKTGKTTITVKSTQSGKTAKLSVVVTAV